LNLDWSVTFLNRESARLFGSDTLTGANFWETFPQLKGTRFQKHVFTALANQTPLNFEDFLEPLAKWVEVHVFPSPVGLAIYIRDINHQKRLEEELNAVESRFRLFVQEAQDYAIVIFDKEGRVVSWNVGAARLYQYRDNEIVGKSCDIFYPPEAAGRASQILAEALVNGKFEEEGWRVKKDGSRFWANVYFAPIIDPCGNRVGFSSVTRDMSERKKLEQERLRLLEEAQQAVQARDEFLSIASHDLRSPLGALYMLLQLMQVQFSDLPEECANHEKMRPIITLAEKGVRQCQRLNQLIDQLLDFTRIRMRQMKLSPREYNLSQDALEIIQSMQAQAERRGSPLQASISPGVEGFWDSVRIGEVLSNLLSNAIKYGDGKPIQVSIAKSKDNRQAVIKVSDQGIGIAKEMHSRIFNRFERASTGKEIAGLGLGLYIVRQIVEAHKGTIAVESEPERGSTFTVELPLRPEVN
jgi:PAS domain S-box-containing protein